MTQLDGYLDENTAIDHPNAWTPANAGSQNEAISNDPASRPFEGGFAGNCVGNLRWTYQEEAETGDPEWECRGEVLEETWNIGGETRSIISFPDFETTAHLPGTPSNGEREIGLTVFGFENIAPEDRESYVPNVGYYADISPDNGELTHAAVRCWAGSFNDKPTNANGEFVENEHSFAEYTSIETDQPNDISQTVNTDGFSGYACEWAYETSDDIGNDGDALARGQAQDVIALHQSQHSNDWDQVSNKFGLEDSEFP